MVKSQKPRAKKQLKSRKGKAKKDENLYLIKEMNL
jgi:hypothetical protein